MQAGAGKAGALKARPGAAQACPGGLAGLGSALLTGLADSACPPGLGPAGAGEDDRSKRLTRREREVATLVAGGLGNREIAEQLFLSKRTVDSHIEHIFTKLGFSSRTQLATWILEQGMQS